jgi:hypothetical protein
VEPHDPSDGGTQREEDDETSSLDSESSASYSASSLLQDNEDTHYVGMDKHKDRNWFQKKTHGITPAGIKQDLLRKTVRWVYFNQPRHVADERRNTWIYVSDMRMNFFVGIKKSGLFQHSSCKRFSSCEGM